MGKKEDQLTVASLNRRLQKKFQSARHQGRGIQDFFQEFLGNFLAEKTRISYINDMKLFSQFLSSGGERVTHPADIESYHLALYRDWMVEQGYAPASINRRMVSIRSFMKWALASKLISYNPLEGVRLPKVQTLSPTQAFDDDEVRKMIESPDINSLLGNTHRLVLVLLFHLGLRRGEIVKIRFRDVHRERNHIALEVNGKGGKKRLVPLNEAVLEEIEAYKSRFFSRTGLSLKSGDYLVQTRPKGKNQRPCDGSTIYRIVSRYARALGITKGVGPHSCRATVISHLLDTQKSPIRDVADFAGHTHTSTTERYDKKRKGLDDSVAYCVNYKLHPLSGGKSLK